MKRKVKQETEYSWKCVYEGKSRNNYNYPLLTGMHVCKKDLKKQQMVTRFDILVTFTLMEIFFAGFPFHFGIDISTNQNIYLYKDTRKCRIIVLSFP